MHFPSTLLAVLTLFAGSALARKDCIIYGPTEAFDEDTFRSQAKEACAGLGPGYLATTPAKTDAAGNWNLGCNVPQATPNSGNIAGLKYKC